MAGYTAIYDSSDYVLGDVTVASISFTDEDYLENFIGQAATKTLSQFRVLGC